MKRVLSFICIIVIFVSICGFISVISKEKPPRSAAALKLCNDADNVKAVQTALNIKGYNCGVPDGVAGPTTQAQILKYQQDRGLPATGIITDDFCLELFAREDTSEENDLAINSKPKLNFTWDELCRSTNQTDRNSLCFNGIVVEIISENPIETVFRFAINGDYNKIIYVDKTYYHESVSITEGNLLQIYGNGVGHVGSELMFMCTAAIKITQ